MAPIPSPNPPPLEPEPEQLELVNNLSNLYQDLNVRYNRSKKLLGLMGTFMVERFGNESNFPSEILEILKAEIKSEDLTPAAVIVPSALSSAGRASHPARAPHPEAKQLSFKCRICSTSCMSAQGLELHQMSHCKVHIQRVQLPIPTSSNKMKKSRRYDDYNCTDNESVEDLDLSDNDSEHSRLASAPPAPQSQVPLFTCTKCGQSLNRQQIIEGEHTNCRTLEPPPASAPLKVCPILQIPRVSPSQEPFTSYRSFPVQATSRVDQKSGILGQKYPSTTFKRGRGRPSKFSPYTVKPEVKVEKHRGRPPKSIPTTSEVKIKKHRGRPPKSIPASSEFKIKKPRGRPRIHDPRLKKTKLSSIIRKYRKNVEVSKSNYRNSQVYASSGESNPDSQSQSFNTVVGAGAVPAQVGLKIKKPVGRPRKNKHPKKFPIKKQSFSSTEGTQKRGPGRPKKIPNLTNGNGDFSYTSTRENTITPNFSLSTSIFEEEDQDSSQIPAENSLIDSEDESSIIKVESLVTTTGIEDMDTEILPIPIPTRNTGEENTSFPLTFFLPNQNGSTNKI